MMTPMYNTKLFTDIYESEEDFLADYDAMPYPKQITTESARTLFYLLYSKYGNNPIANMDEEQFKFKLFSLVFQYGGTWEKELEIQSKLRSLSDEELAKGYRMIYNRSYNPSEQPATSTLEELQTINEQTSTNHKRSKIEAYAALMELLNDKITDRFVNKFKTLFKIFVYPENPLLYISDEEEDD